MSGIRPEAVAVAGVGQGARAVATEGWVVDEVLAVQPLLRPTSPSPGADFGWSFVPRAGGPGPVGPPTWQSAGGWRSALDWSRLLLEASSEPPQWQPGMPGDDEASAFETVGVVHAWLCSDEVLAAAAAGASAGRLEPVVRAWAVRELVAAGAVGGDGARIAVLFEAVRRSMLYVPSPVGAQWISFADATTALDGEAAMPAGNCVDYAIKLAAALLSVGIRSVLVGQARQPDGLLDHVVVAAWDGEQWLRLDPTEPRARPGEAQRAYRETWVLLPEQRLLSDGAPPEGLLVPPTEAPERFVAIGLGRPGTGPLVLSPVRGLGAAESQAGWLLVWVGCAVVAAAVGIALAAVTTAAEAVRKAGGAR